jgi:hypothetical protein
MHPFIIVSIIGLVVAVPDIGSEVTFPARSYSSGGFSESCYHTGIKSNTWTLQSTCANSTGTEAAASLDLSRCLGVGAGDVLVCDPGMSASPDHHLFMLD